MKTSYTTYNNFAKRLVMSLIVLMTVGVGTVFADTYTWTLASGDLGGQTSPASSVKKGSPAITWNTTYTWGTSSKYLGWDGSNTKKGVQIGSGSAYCTKAVFSTSDISGTITNITVNGSHASSGGASIVIKVGGETVKSSTNFTTTATDYSTGTISKSGQIEITISNSKTKAFYLKSITITYTASATPSTYTVTCQSNNASYGTVSPTSITNVANNTSISANGNVLTVGTKTVTATPKAQDANYNYRFTSWTGIPTGGKVTANITVTANFACTTRQLTNYRTSCSTTPLTQLTTPTGLEAINIEQTSATIKWNSVTNAENYTITINDKTITTGDNYCNVTGLTAGTQYTWTIKASADGYSDSNVATHTFSTKAAPLSIYTITWNVAGNTTEVEYTEGTPLELPNQEPTCHGKTFVGWTEIEHYTHDTSAPLDLFDTAIGIVTENKTYYAVFATVSISGGEERIECELDFSSNDWNIPSENANKKVDETSYSNGTYTIKLAGSSGNGYYYNSNQILIGKNGAYMELPAFPFKVSKIVSTTPTETVSGRVSWNIYSGDESVSTPLTGCTEGGTFEINENYQAIGTIYTIKVTNENNLQIKKLQIYTSEGSTYSNYTTSCVASFSITYDFAGGTGSHCSNTSVPQGNTYTICDEAPTREGHTFQGWSDGTNTYAAGATITPSGDVTLTAIWQIKTYTVTWNNNGDTDEVTYNHGDALVVPAAPVSCDGVKEFVGWTTHSGYYHATTAPDDIFTTKTTPVTATATYYAVFATPPTTGSGGGGSETTTTLDFTAQGYANAAAISNLTVNGVTATFDKGSNSNAPKYYSTGTAIRAYGGNTITLSSAGTITKVTFTFSNGDDGNEITTNNGDGEWNEPTWTGNTTSNIVFTIDGASGHRRIKSIAVTCTSGGGSGSHSDYTTICQQVESIVVTNPKTDFILTEEFTIGEGTVTATLSRGGTADVTTLATFSGYNMEVVGTYTVTVTYMGATATYNINVNPLDDAWVLTWNVSGKTNTGLGPRSVPKDSAIGELPIPEVPAACAGKTFMGWTTSNIVNSDGSGITYITRETVPTANTTYYAVFATVNNFSVQKPIDQIASGSKVVIVAVASLDAGGTTGKAISSRTAADGNNLASDDVFVLDEQINTPHSTCVWTLTREVSGKYTFTQDGKYLNAVVDPDKETSGFCKFNSTKDTWTISEGATNTYRMLSTNQNKYVEWFTATGVFKVFHIANTYGTFDMHFFVTANANGEADITDYTTGCAEYTITYYGFQGGYSTSCSSDGTIVLPVNSLHTIPNCGDVVKDHTNLNRTFTGVWMTKPHGGQTFKPGDTFILTQDTTLYAQWELNTQNDFTTLPTDVEDLAGTDIYVYGGKTLTLQPGTTTINSLTLKGGIQTDGSYQMPSVWVPEGATLVRNSNKIYLDLVVNAKTWYPFAVPFETKNTSDIHYLHPDMKSAATYSKHFDIKTYDGARRADVGEDKANNWVRLKRHTAEEPVSFKPGVGYIISAMAYPGTDTATIRIPMTVPNTWFKNGEQAVVGTTVRNTIDVTAHTGEAATEHQRHAGWNFVANPYLTSFAGGNVANDGGLAYINGALIIEGSYEYTDEEVPYVTIPAYNFAYYSQHKLSDVKLSPEWSFFVQVGTGGTMNFTTAGRQQAPASIAARNAEERPVKMDVDITLSDNHNSDQTGIIISDRYNDTYEIGRDLEKLFGSAYNLSVYTLMADNTPLAFQALAIRSSMQVIPVGYRAPEQGEYTFRLNEATSSIDLLNEQYEQLVLVDYQTGELTNLLISDYTFYSERTQADNRFAIYAVPRQNAPTDLPNAIGQDKQAQKIIHNGHLYILRDGNVYNGNGQIVK